MKKSFLKLFSLTLVAVIASCDNKIEVGDKFETSADKPFEVQIAGEEKAIETFNNFINRLNSDVKTRSTISASQVISVRKTTTAAYSSKPQTRSGNPVLPVYELTLENPDKTQGFAVVTDAATIDEVIAYSPQGSIADTVFNKSLALYFRELAMLSEVISNKTATRADYWQPGWDEIFNVEISEYEFIRWLTSWEINNRPNKNYSWEFYDPVDKMEVISAYVPTLWGQGNPYNNRVPYCVNGTRNKVNVGCYAVAVGQVMAFHKFPPTYNWNLLTISQKIDPTPISHSGDIIESEETASQKEVSQLLMDIATAGKTDFKTDRNSGSTPISMIIPGLNSMGYDVNETYMDNKGGSSLLIKEEIQNYYRPVLYCAQSDAGGHIWVIDAILTQERWKYQSAWFFNDEYFGREGLQKCRVQGNLMHCNWGWYRNSNGWYYNFTTPHNDKVLNFNRGKLLYTGIKPK